MKKQSCQLNSLKDFTFFAKKLSKNLGRFHIIALRGELGSGKTTLAQALGKTMGIKQRMVSPSFVLMKLYKLPRNKYAFTHLCHADFYRTHKSSFAGVHEYLENKKILTLVEWPEKLKNLPRKRLELIFTIMNNDTRKITLLPKYEKKKRA